MVRHIILTFLTIIPMLAQAEKQYECNGHVENISLYQGPLKDENAFKPERAFDKYSSSEDNTLLYVDKAQLTLNIQADD